MSSISRFRAHIMRTLLAAVVFGLGLASSGTEAAAQGGSCAPQDVNQACWWDPACQGGCYPFGCSSGLCEWIGDKVCVICIQS